MEALPALLAEQARALSIPEVIAVIAAVLYLLLAIRESLWCWLFAALSTAIYVYLFFGARLYMESALNVFYFAMAVYGWQVWLRGETADQHRPVVRWPLTVHATALVLILLASVVSGYLLDRHSDAEFPYIDSMTTWSAIWATFLVARKVLENWWYWLVIDLASIVIYWSRDLQLTALLFVVYVLMIPFGLIRWRQSWQMQHTT